MLEPSTANKWYTQRCSLAHFEGTVDFNRNEFTCT